MAENKILIIRGGAIGDFILTLPVLRALRETFPDTTVDVLGYPRIASLAQWGGLAEGVRPLEDRSLAYFFARQGTLDPGWMDYFSSFPIIVSYLFDPDAYFESNVKRCHRGQFLKGLHRPDDALGRHATEVLLEPLQRLAIFGADPTPVLRPARTGGLDSKPGPVSESAEADFFSLVQWVQQAPTVALHPGSGSPKKNWAFERWKQLVRQFADSEEWQFLLVGGEAEREDLKVLAEGVPETRLRCAMNLPLPQLARLLSHCEKFLGHDSGISHLAAAVGCPTWALWGPSVSQVWKPLGSHVTLVQASGGLDALSVEQAFESVRSVPLR